MKLCKLADHLGATLHGDPDVEIHGIAGIEAAGPGQITFVANKRYAPLARTTRAAAILVEPAFAEISTPTLRIADPYLAYARTIELFYTPPRPQPGIHPTAVIAPSARIGARAHIAPYVVIGEEVEIGEDAILHPTSSSTPEPASARASSPTPMPSSASTAVSETTSSSRTEPSSARTASALPAPAKAGTRSSNPAPPSSRIRSRFRQTPASTALHRRNPRQGWRKIDNLVQVGHGSTVGEHTLLCAQVGLAGSTVVGKNVILAGQVGVAGHCTIGDGAVATAQSGIPNDIAPGAIVSGYPAVENRQWLRTVAAVNRLPEIVRELRKLRGNDEQTHSKEVGRND